jgi:hypothetical protein
LWEMRNFHWGAMDFMAFLRVLSSITIRL